MQPQNKLSERTKLLRDEEEKGSEWELPWYVWLIVVCVDILGPFSTDSYVPSLEGIEEEFGASIVSGGLTLQINWLVLGIAAMAVGAASDGRLGRRGTLLFSLVFYVVGTAGCSVAQTIRQFTIFRVVQALGETSTVVATAVPRDVVLDVDKRGRLCAVLGSLRLIAILISPMIGGLIGSAWGWRNVFRILAFWGISLFIGAALFFPETRPLTLARMSSLSSTTNCVDGFSIVLGSLARQNTEAHQLATGAIFVFAITFGAVLSWTATVSNILEGVYGLGVVETSIIFGSFPAVIIVVNLVVARFFRPKVKGQFAVRCLRTALLDMLLVAGTTSLLLFWRNLVRSSWIPFVSNMWIFAVAQALTVGPAQTLAMEPFPDHAGAASSVLNISRTLTSSAVSFAATHLVKRFGVNGLFAVLLTSCLLCQIAWIRFWPVVRSHNGSAVVVPNDLSCNKLTPISDSSDDNGAASPSPLELP